MVCGSLFVFLSQPVLHTVSLWGRCYHSHFFSDKGPEAQRNYIKAWAQWVESFSPPYSCLLSLTEPPHRSVTEGSPAVVFTRKPRTGECIGHLPFHSRNTKPPRSSLHLRNVRVYVHRCMRVCTWVGMCVHKKLRVELDIDAILSFKEQSKMFFPYLRTKVHSVVLNTKWNGLKLA